MKEELDASKESLLKAEKTISELINELSEEKEKGKEFKK